MKVYIYEHVTCAPEKAHPVNRIEHGFAWRLKAGCKQMNMKEFDKYMTFIRKNMFNPNVKLLPGGDFRLQYFDMRGKYHD